MIRLAVHAHPGARQDRAQVLADGSLGVWVRARAVDGQANAAIERLLAVCLDLKPRQVAVVAGGRGRDKVVQVDLPSAEEVRERLSTLAVAHGVRPRGE